MMQFVPLVTSSISPQIPPKTGTAFLRKHPILLDTIQPVLAIIDPKPDMEQPLHPQTQHPTGSCLTGPLGKSCGNLDLRVVILLGTLAGALILVLLYKLLQMRHRLKLARARQALEYNSFYHRATYKLRQPTPSQDLPTKNGSFLENSPSIQTVAVVTPVVIPPVPPIQVPLPLTLPLPPPPVPPSPLPHPPTSRVLSLPLPMPAIHTTPPSPHLSWGACSDADVYSRIGAFRPSRLSSLSSRSTVILFEHSSL